MSDDATRLRELLAYYGSDIRQWPEDAQALGHEALQRPESATMIEEERHFEQMMLARHIPMPSSGLSQRIITAAFACERVSASIGWFRELFADLRPAALAAMLVLGFAIGFGMVTFVSHAGNTASFAHSIDDEGAIL